VRGAPATIAVILALAVGACGGGDSEADSGASGATGAAGASGATGAEGVTAEQVPVDGPPVPGITVEQVAGLMPLPEPIADDPAFKENLDVLIAAPHKYFSETLDKSGYEYHMPDEFIAYDGASGDRGPDCGGAPAGRENAAYCRDPRDKGSHGIITWDETGLIQPLYDDLGDGSTAFIMGHEFAHLFQDQFGTIQKFPLTVEKELNADCLTGAYLGAYRDKGGVNYSRADMQSIIDGITVVGDAPGTPWQDIHAHGSAAERKQAFFLGFETSIDRCIKQLRPGFSVR
jgi:hypothetical protein